MREQPPNDGGEWMLAWSPAWPAASNESAMNITVLQPSSHYASLHYACLHYANLHTSPHYAYYIHLPGRDCAHMRLGHIRATLSPRALAHCISHECAHATTVSASTIRATGAVAAPEPVGDMPDGHQQGYTLDIRRCCFLEDLAEQRGSLSYRRWSHGIAVHYCIHGCEIYCCAAWVDILRREAFLL